MNKYRHKTRGHPSIKQLFAFLLTLIVLVSTTPDLAKADAIEHTHIWADKYDNSNHWKYCTVCGTIKDKEAHTFTDHWAYGHESCNWSNPSTRTCSCGYSYVYHKPHSKPYVTVSHTYYERQHWLQCPKCGDSVNQIACYDDDGPLTCSNPGTCKVCGGTSPANHHQINSQGICIMCKKKFFTITDNSYTYSSDYSCVNWQFKVIPVDNTVKVTGTTTWCAPGTCNKKSGQIIQNDDGSYTVKITLNVLYSKNTAMAAWSYDNITVNGSLSWVVSAVTISGFYRDHTAPNLLSVTQTDQASANGWATIKQLTFEGTEDSSDIVYLTISDKLTGEKYLTDAAVPVTNGKYSYTCTPSIEGDINGRTYVVTVKDHIGNTSTKEFVTSRTDGSAPQIKSGTSLNYTDWTNTAKNISLNFFDFGAGEVQASLDNQADYKPLTKSGEYYVWSHSFGDQVGTSEHTIYVKDALGNATSYKLTVGNTDSNVYSINYNLNGGAMNGQKTSYTVADSFTLSQPTKTGYTFTGWTGSNGTTPQKTVTVTKGNTGNKNYTANWSANSYYVTFNGNEGSLHVMDGTIAKNNNGTATAKVQYDLNYYYLLGILATKPGYTLKGFYDAPSGGVQVFKPDNQGGCTAVQDGKYYDNNNIWKYTGNITFYAQWEPITWTTKYDANGGNGTMADTTHRFNCGNPIRHNQFTRPGWTMIGWTYSRVRNGVTEWMYGNTDGSWKDSEQWYELNKNPNNTKLYVEYNLDGIDNSSTYINGDIHVAHAQWQYNPISVKIPQILTGDSTGKSQFRVKCDDLKAGSIKVTVPNSFPYKQTGKVDVTATITSKSGNNIITPSNKVCVYNITTTNGLSAGCWQGSFNIGLTLTKE